MHGVGVDPGIHRRETAAERHGWVFLASIVKDRSYIVKSSEHFDQ